MEKTLKKKKAGLGRGLGNLLDTNFSHSEKKTQPAIDSDKNIVEIDIELIRANPDNPRKVFDRTSIDELATTVREFGLLQPILVQSIDNHYVVISGERRLRACRQLKLPKVPCIVKEFGNQEVLEVSLIENIQREQLNAVEEGVVYKSLLEKFDLTQEKLSERVGKNRATIANRIRLLQLPLSIQTAIADQRLTEGQVRPLLTLNNENLIQKIANEILTNQLSSRQVEDLVNRYKGKSGTKQPSKQKKEPPEVTALKNELMEIFQTRVDIRHNFKNGKGSIIIEYFSIDDCENIVNQIKTIKK
jgi:ParB family chromosome partitioning protein